MPSTYTPPTLQSAGDPMAQAAAAVKASTEEQVKVNQMLAGGRRRRSMHGGERELSIPAGMVSQNGSAPATYAGMVGAAMQAARDSEGDNSTKVTEVTEKIGGRRRSRRSRRSRRKTSTRKHNGRRSKRGSALLKSRRTRRSARHVRRS